MRRRAKEVRLECVLRCNPELVPAATAVIGKASGLGLSVPVVVRQTVAQRRTHDVCLAAVLGVILLRLAVNVDDVLTSVTQGRQHPHKVVAMGVDSVGEVEAAAPTLGIYI